MKHIESVADLRESLRIWRMRGESIAFVPTMGNLHAGHLHLVEEAKKQAERVVVSIFVNPTQFSAGEDFGSYPRTPEKDAAQLRESGVDLLFMPDTETMYPRGSSTFVEVPGISETLCGSFRPGHFRGVATVVCKLFNMVQPEVALFGEKDFQQLTVIHRMVADLNLPVRVIGVPTVREANGLAMSSRNGYLSTEEKSQAALLYQSLLAAKAALEAGERDYRSIETQQLENLKEGGFVPDYFVIRKVDLAEPASCDRDFVILLAARLGKARLIDNIRVRV
ncbi:MAG: pantoate--beta-alanine ligase [Methylococcaceae bacterium]|nr:pantoate--beta-alanine ligase [Methylococcaceae bacterium]